MTKAYLWFDTEFTSLDFDSARLLQVSMLATDPQCKRLAPPERDLNLIIKLPDEAKVSPWVEENLGSLVDRCRSEEAVTEEEADRALCAYTESVVGPVSKTISHRPVLAGNSIHTDLYMVRKFFPHFYRCLHYRLLDVTSLKLQWEDIFRGEEFNKEDENLILKHFPDAGTSIKGRPHDAYYDILASIAELNFYRRNLTKANPE